MKGEDSNLDIMPPRKKKNNNKGPNKLNLKKTTLSKSQKRKLKKLEEEKERELLSAKTTELLDKYKISEDVSSLLQSSKAIGRSDTKLEKRRRPMQLSKAGVLSDEPVKENDHDDDSDSFMDDEPTTTPEINHFPTTLQTDSDQLVHANEMDSKEMTISVDYIGEAYKKVMSIHKKLPQGGILVFVTGQREVDNLCERLRKASKEQAARRCDSEDDDGSFGGFDMKEIAEAFDDDSNTHDYRFNSFGEDPYETSSNVSDDFDEEDMYDDEYDYRFNFFFLRTPDWRTPLERRFRT